MALRHQRLYRIWQAMKNRCNNPKSPAYHRYGGRGITVCGEWLHDFNAFREWAISNGYTDRLSIDRINNDSGYYPENCRWADDFTQANNTRHCHVITWDGESHTLSEWARIMGVSRATLNNRINTYGWSLERAITVPVGKYVRKKGGRTT